MTKYAILNRNGMVERIKEVSEALANPPPNWIEVSNNIVNTDIIGKYYHNGEFVSISPSANTATATLATAETQAATDYYPIYSTYEIFRADNATHDLEQDLQAIEADISALETGKADTTHTHTEYSPTTHTHSEYAAVDHNHSGVYSTADHAHTVDEITETEAKKVMTAAETILFCVPYMNFNGGCLI